MITVQTIVAHASGPLLATTILNCAISDGELKISGINEVFAPIEIPSADQPNANSVIVRLVESDSSSAPSVSSDLETQPVLSGSDTEN